MTAAVLAFLTRAVALRAALCLEAILHELVDRRRLDLTRPPDHVLYHAERLPDAIELVDQVAVGVLGAGKFGL